MRNTSRVTPPFSVVFGLLYALILLGCNEDPEIPQFVTSTPTFSSLSILKATSTIAPSITSTTVEKTRLIFYGDSALAVGQAGDGIMHEGFSFINNLSELLDNSFVIITANYGGRSAKWGYENLSDAVLNQQPDVATLWWGLNDLGSCPGIFDRDTNQLNEDKLEVLAKNHLQYLDKQIGALLEQGISVYIMTTFPVLNGKLPWSHFDENNNLVWENNHWCNFNLALFELVEGQRELVTLHQNSGDPVYLVDVWQVYMDHPNDEKMYMDVVHPASHGVQLIAEEWARVFFDTHQR